MSFLVTAAAKAPPESSGATTRDHRVDEDRGRETTTTTQHFARTTLRSQQHESSSSLSQEKSAPTRRRRRQLPEDDDDGCPTARGRLHNTRGRPWRGVVSTTIGFAALACAPRARAAFDLAFVDSRTGLPVPRAKPGFRTLVYTDDPKAITIEAVTRSSADHGTIPGRIVQFEATGAYTNFSVLYDVGPEPPFVLGFPLPSSDDEGSSVNNATSLLTEEDDEEEEEIFFEFGERYTIVARELVDPSFGGLTSEALFTDAATGRRIKYQETISFTLMRSPPQPEILRLVSLDAADDTGEVFDEITQASGGCMYYPYGDLTIRADATPGTTAVKFELHGCVNGADQATVVDDYSFLDTTFPFSLYGEAEGSFVSDLFGLSSASIDYNKGELGASILENFGSECLLYATPYSSEGVPGETLSVLLSGYDDCGRPVVEVYVGNVGRVDAKFDLATRSLITTSGDSTARYDASTRFVNGASLPIYLMSQHDVNFLNPFAIAHPAVKHVQLRLRQDRRFKLKKEYSSRDDAPFALYGSTTTEDDSEGNSTTSSIRTLLTNEGDLTAGPQYGLSVKAWSRKYKNGAQVFLAGSLGLAIHTKDSTPATVTRAFIGEKHKDAPSYAALEGDLMLPGYHRTAWSHARWSDHDIVDSELWYHGDEDKVYNLCVELSQGTAYVAVEGAYYPYHRFEGPFGTVDRRNATEIPARRVFATTAITSPESDAADNWTAPVACLLAASDFANHPKDAKTGDNFLAPGEFNVTVTPYGFDDVAGETLELTQLLILASPQRTPIFEGGLTVELEIWKDPVKWNKKNDVAPVWRFYVISCVKGIFGDVYLSSQFHGKLLKWSQNDEPIDEASQTTTTGLSLFLDLEAAMEAQGRDLGKGSYWHGGFRSFDFHPLGNASHGKFYVSAMETQPDNVTKELWREEGLYLNWAAYQYYPEHPTPQDEESVVIEFTYIGGVADPTSYRLLFRVECPIYDHTIRQVSFGVDDLTTIEDESLYLYILHGDGSVESKDVGNGQYDDALGKILRIEPLNGTFIDKNRSASAESSSDEPLIFLDPAEIAALVLEPGEYSTEHNPWDDRDNYAADNTPGFKLTSLPLNPKANRSPVPREAFAIGFRNPHSLAFTSEGELILGEALRDTFEEVNVIKKGADYGWPFYEGTFEHIVASESEVRGLFHSALVPDASHYCPTCELRFPLVAYGHRGYDKMGFNSIALVGENSVVENDSEVGNHVDEPNAPHAYRDGAKYFFSDFPAAGNLYYLYLDDARHAHATGDPAAGDVSIAPVYEAKVKFEGVVYPTLREVMSKDAADTGERTNCRFGTGPDGELIIFSKETGLLYRVVNTLQTPKVAPEPPVPTGADR